jgi:hypothetical protein
MKYLAAFFLIIFLLFAFVQLNDPDPVFWFAIYATAAYVSWRAFRLQYNRELLTTLIALFLGLAVNSFLQMTAYEGFFTEGAGMDMKTINQELLREGCGVAICIFVFVLYLLHSVRLMKASARPS